MTIFSTPLALVAELTHRCPLHCVYCSNPLELAKREAELSTETWIRIFDEAAAFGVIQADFTGGEPLVRTDIAELVHAARKAGLYVSLITSGVPLDERKLAALVEAGADHIQLSFQGATEKTGREISGTSTHKHKLHVLNWLKRYRVGVTMNFVLHRQNINELEAMLNLVEEHRPGCVEFASVQYYGWGFANRAHLLPTREQLDNCVTTLKNAEVRLKGKTRVVFVVPDYYAKYPKPCVGGWGQKLILISPEGTALPCHSAKVIPNLCFDNLREKSLREIWETSSAFMRFRGEDWMQEPCRSCNRRHLDFAGCRCQAFLLSGNSGATDPVCSLAPTRSKVDAILADANISEEPKWVYRPNPS
jgi:PqqA peptide cyclase